MIMIFIQLGNSGIEASAIGLGTCAIGGGEWWWNSDQKNLLKQFKCNLFWHKFNLYCTLLWFWLE